MKNYLLIGLINLGFVEILRGCSAEELGKVAENLSVIRAAGSSYPQGSSESVAYLNECIKISVCLNRLLTRAENQLFKKECIKSDDRVVKYLASNKGVYTQRGLVNYVYNLEVERAVVDLCGMRESSDLLDPRGFGLSSYKHKPAQLAFSNISAFLDKHISRPVLKRKRS